MIYCTFQFDILYQNGRKKSGSTPYRGNGIENADLASFVENYFAGPKLILKILISQKVVFDDPKEWIATVRNWRSFQNLQSVNNYAGDLLQEYFPTD